MVPLVDGQAVAQAKYLLDIGLEPTEAVAALKVLTEGFGRFAAMMREPAFRLLVKPGASEIDIAAAAEALAQAAIPHAGPMLENLLRVQYRRMFEAEAIGVADARLGRYPAPGSSRSPSPTSSVSRISAKCLCQRSLRVSRVGWQNSPRMSWSRPWCSSRPSATP